MEAEFERKVRKKGRQSLKEKGGRKGGRVGKKKINIERQSLKEKEKHREAEFERKG